MRCQPVYRACQGIISLRAKLNFETDSTNQRKRVGGAFCKLHQKDLSTPQSLSKYSDFHQMTSSLA